MNMFLKPTALLLTVLLSSTCLANHSIEIETRILNMDPQPGMKSLHTIIVDFKNKTVKSSFKTGTTDFFGVKLSSV